MIMTPVTSVRRAGVVVVVTALAAMLPGLLGAYALDTAARMLALGVLAVSVTVLTGHAGLPTLGQVAPAAAGAYTAAVLSRAGVDVGLLLLLAAAVGGVVCAAVTAPLVVWARGVVVLMATLAVQQLAGVAATQWVAVTGGSNGTTITYPRLFWGLPPLADDRDMYWYVLAVTVGCLVATWWVLRCPWGLLLRGVRENEIRMGATGHPVTGYLTLAYLGAGGLAGVAGYLLITSQQYLSPDDLGFTTAALVLLAVTIGGATSIGGAVFGAALIVVTRDWLAGPWPGHAPLLLGALFIATVYLLPYGAAGLLRTVQRRLHRQFGTNVDEAGLSPVQPWPGLLAGVARKPSSVTPTAALRRRTHD
jgi:branched-chain amino acid transport system permease protein